MENYVRLAKDALRRSEGSPNADLARLAKIIPTLQIDWARPWHSSLRRGVMRCTDWRACGLADCFTVGARA